MIFNQHGSLSEHHRNIVKIILGFEQDTARLTIEAVTDMISQIERKAYRSAAIREDCKVLVRKDVLFQWKRGDFSTVKVAPSYRPKAA